MNYIILFFYIYYGINIYTSKLKPFLLILLYFFLQIIFHLLKKNKIKKSIIRIIGMCTVFLLIPILITFTGNNFYIQLDFIKFYFLQLCFILYIYTFLIKNLKNKKLEEVIEMVINIIFFQVILSAIIYPFPKLTLELNKIFNTGELYIEVLIPRIGKRFLGVGTSFFEMGVNNSVALIFCTYLLTIYNYKYKNRVLIKYFILIIIGSIGSRSTLIGMVLSIIYYIFNSSIQEKIKMSLKSIKILLFYIVLPSIPIIVLFKNKILYLINYGFEILINYYNGKGLSTSSTDVMFNMYKKVPENIKTWIIGDGKYKEGIYYYMKTDIGYLRIIFYSGLVGLIGIFLFKFYLFYVLKKNTNNKRILSLMFFIIILDIILNLKGVTNLYSYQYLIVIIIILQKKSYGMNSICNSTNFYSKKIRYIKNLKN